MKTQLPTDFETYCEIMDDLIRPIYGTGLEPQMLKRLYESKLVYLENLRGKCFLEMNRPHPQAFFTVEDYQLILQAISHTHKHLRDLILLTLNQSLAAIPLGGAGF